MMESYIITLNITAIPEKIREEPEYNIRQELMEKEAKRLVIEIGLSGTIERVYGGAFFGFVLRTTEEEIKILSEDPRVKYIEKDQGINLSPL